MTFNSSVGKDFLFFQSFPYFHLFVAAHHKEMITGYKLIFLFLVLPVCPHRAYDEDEQTPLKTHGDMFSRAVTKLQRCSEWTVGSKVQQTASSEQTVSAEWCCCLLMMSKAVSAGHTCLPTTLVCLNPLLTLVTRVRVPLGRSGRSSSESRPLPKLSMEWEEMVWQSSSKE